VDSLKYERPCAAILLIAIMALSLCGSALGVNSKKPRIIATTDGEVDDRCSMVRFLLYASEWDIRGLIHSSSKHHWKGDENHPGKRWEPVGWLDRQLDAYAKVHSNLKRHDPAYPSPAYLRSQVFVGNIGFEGDMTAPTPGSNRIVEVLLESDNSPVWLQAWGGSNTIARALKTIQEEHPERIEEVTRKARLYLITEQDQTLKSYIRPEWPGIQVLRSSGSSFGAIAYRWQSMQPKEIQRYFDKEWMTRNILKGHGPLCALYEAKDGRFRSEGDTPAFLHVIDTGLGSAEHPAFGGWGGRFALSSGVWKSVDAANSSPHSILRWAKDFQNDWAARADWCVKGYAQANHNPKVVVNGMGGTNVVRIQAQPGSTVELSATGSSDPDGDDLSYKWWYYRGPSTYSDDVRIEGAHGKKVSFTVPHDSKANEFHIVLTVRDNGSPNLVAYRRVIVRSPAATGQAPPSSLVPASATATGEAKVNLSRQVARNQGSGICHVRWAKQEGESHHE